MSYQFASGHDNTAGLADIVLQPASPKMMGSDRFITSDGGAVLQGARYAELVYTALDQDGYNSLRTQFGLTDTVTSVEATLRLYQNDGTFANFNAILDHDPVEHVKGRRFTLLSDVVFVVRELEAL